ncbi:uncharacterized protein LOC142226657 [Haematobia irritans]|uniref:Putative secreted protein n=2 Tax=Haematobia irritans TaxID=7368 RepID=A0A1L8EBF4_HAEIR
MDIRSFKFIFLILVLIILQNCNEVTANSIPTNEGSLQTRCELNKSCPITTKATTPAPAIIPQEAICRQSAPFMMLTQLLLTECHDCTNPSCLSSPEGASFPYPNHCQYFWKCQGGMPTLCYCPNGMWFDRERSICDLCPNVLNCPANIN